MHIFLAMQTQHQSSVTASYSKYEFYVAEDVDLTSFEMQKCIDQKNISFSMNNESVKNHLFRRSIICLLT